MNTHAISKIQVALTEPNLWSRGISHLFFLFFASPVLSPSIAEKTFYLNWVIPLLDPYFYRYLHALASRIQAQTLLSSAALMIYFLAVSPILAARWVLILWPLAYLHYSYDTRMFYLYQWITFNVLVACAQAAAYFVGGPPAAFLIGPVHISKLIWGAYATPTFANFYSIVPGIDLPRFSGLSREGGFFAALLATVILLKRGLGIRVGMLLFVGVILSLSKSTVFLVFGWLIVLAALRDRRTPTGIFLVFFVLFILAYYMGIDEKLMTGGLSASFTHRFYAYGALFHDMDLTNWLVGNNPSALDITQFASFQTCMRKTTSLAGVSGYVLCIEMPSFAALVVKAGAIGLCLYLWQLLTMGIKFWGVVLIFILTSNVFPMTETSFVVLSYFLAQKVGELPRQARELGFVGTSGLNPAS